MLSKVLRSQLGAQKKPTPPKSYTWPLMGLDSSEQHNPQRSEVNITLESCGPESRAQTLTPNPQFRVQGLGFRNPEPSTV